MWGVDNHQGGFLEVILLICVISLISDELVEVLSFI